MNQDTTYNWNPEYTAECDIQNGLADEQARAESEKAEEESNVIKCNHEPIIETVTDYLPGGIVYQHSVNGNICYKCGELL